jgi:hypothetical protein
MNFTIYAAQAFWLPCVEKRETKRYGRETLGKAHTGGRE